MSKKGELMEIPLRNMQGSISVALSWCGWGQGSPCCHMNTFFWMSPFLMSVTAWMMSESFSFRSAATSSSVNSPFSLFSNQNLQ